MSPKAARLGYLAWLISCAIFAYWFAYVGLTALLNLQRDAGGNLVLYSSGAGHTAYPFTYLGAGLSFVLITYFIFRSERGHRDAIVTASLTAYLTSVGMINIYEQFFLLATAHAGGGTYALGVDWGSPDAALFSAFGLSWFLTSFAWWDRRNVMLAAVPVAIYIVSLLAWVAIGFPIVENGNPMVYILNSISRIASQLIPVALVVPPNTRMKIGELATRLPGIDRLNRVRLTWRSSRRTE
jgi:hypothetical protein